MKKTLCLTSLLIIVLMISCKTQKAPEAPVAEKIPEELVNHDHTRIDNYY